MKKEHSKGFFILSIANVASKALSLLYIPLLIATIGDEGYGIYYAAYSVFSFIFMMTITGTSSVIPKLIAEYSATGHEDDAKASFNIGRRMLLVMGFTMCTLMIVFARPLTKFMGYEKSLLAILSLAPCIILASINSSYRSYFQGRNNMTPIAVSQFVEQIGNTVFTILCSYILSGISLEWGVAGGAIGTTIGGLISVLWLLYCYYGKERKIVRESKPRTKTNKELLKYMCKYATPMILSTGIIYAGNNLIDVANIKNGLLKAGFTDTLATIRYGNFGNFMQLINVPLIIISALSLTIFPLIAKSNASGDKNELCKNITQTFKVCFLISFPASIGLFILAEPIFNMIFVSSTSKGADIMRFGAFIVLTSATSQLANTMLNSIGKVYRATSSAIIGVIFKILSNFILIPIAYINIYGAIIGLGLSQIIPFIINYLSLKKHIETKDSLIYTWKKPFLSSVIMGIVVYASFNGVNLLLSQHLSAYSSSALATIVSIIIGAFVYVNSLILTKAIDNEDMNIVPYRLRKILFIAK